jgi:endoglucanase Acf2
MLNFSELSLCSTYIIGLNNPYFEDPKSYLILTKIQNSNTIQLMDQDKKKQKSNIIKLVIIVAVILTTVISCTLIAYPNLNPFSSKNKMSTDYQQEYTSVDDIIKKESNITNNTFKITNTNEFEEVFINDKNQQTYLPTNRIWSSAIFSGQIKGLYSLPLAFETDEKAGTLKVSKPAITAQEKTIYGALGTNFIELLGNRKIVTAIVTDWSDLTVQYDLKDKDNKVIYQLIVVQGSPYVYIKPVSSNITFKRKSYEVQNNRKNLTLKNEQGYLSFFNYNELKRPSDADIVLEGDKWITIGWYPNENNYDKIAQHANSIVTKIWAEAEKNENGFSSKFSIKYEGDKTGTILSILPDQYSNQPTVFDSNSIRGTQRFIEVNDVLQVPVKAEPIMKNLPFRGTEKQKNDIKAALKADFASDKFVSDTSYFGGKKLAKLARMAEIADSIGEQGLRDTYVQALKTKMIDWLTYTKGEGDTYLERDYATGGILTRKESFGSELYSDHHFQHGYFVHAAAVLAEYDNTFAKEYGESMNIWIKDIVNIDHGDNRFPYVRNFDWFEGHSWASGVQLFGDGNNQESTSEAINAYWGTWKWAEATGNTELTTYAHYLYSREVQATKEYWLGHSNNIKRPGYNYNKVSLLWGGKADYATWFSAEPLAIEAIQYLPITPGSVYLNNQDVVKRDYNSFVERGISVDPQSKFADINAAYFAIALPEFQNKNWSNYDIDDGNSISNMLAWSAYWRKDSTAVGGSVNSGITYNKQTNELKVTSIQPNSLFANAGIKNNDSITRINDVLMSSFGSDYNLEKTLQTMKGSDVKVTVSREDIVLDLKVTIPL